MRFVSIRNAGLRSFLHHDSVIEPVSKIMTMMFITPRNGFCPKDRNRVILKDQGRIAEGEAGIKFSPAPGGTYPTVPVEDPRSLTHSRA